jgi:hypothetical protein
MTIVNGACVKTISTTCSALQYDYTEESAAIQARAFSATGKWFAFTTASSGSDAESFLYWADLSAQPWTLKRKVALDPFNGAVPPTELRFSPDDHYLLVQRGGLLTAFELTAAPNSGARSLLIPIDQSAPTGTPATSVCSEDFPSDPAHWCGSADRDAPFTWSPDSTFAAYQAVGGLKVLDFTAFPSMVLPPDLPAPDCNQQCAGQFAFQPTKGRVPRPL